MAFALISDFCVQDALKTLLRKVEEGIKVDLYTNDFTPLRTSVIGDFTLAAYPGYAQVEIAPRPVTLDGSHRGQIVPGVVTFSPPSSGGDVTVHGFVAQYLSDVDSGHHIFMSARFAAPAVLSVGGAGVIFNLFARTFDAH
jgi:hypothetical protein